MELGGKVSASEDPVGMQSRAFLGKTRLPFQGSSPTL